MSSVLPAWVHQLVDGLVRYEDEHPKLYADTSFGFQPVDECPGVLLALVPQQARDEAATFMAGWRAKEAADGDGRGVTEPQPKVGPQTRIERGEP